jgi:hypothetical protein
MWINDICHFQREGESKTLLKHRKLARQRTAASGKELMLWMLMDWI